jgi:hypothetical protein
MNICDGSNSDEALSPLIQTSPNIAHCHGYLRIPAELHLHIFSNLNPRSLLSLGQVSPDTLPTFMHICKLTPT